MHGVRTYAWLVTLCAFTASLTGCDGREETTGPAGATDDAPVVRTDDAPTAPNLVAGLAYTAEPAPSEQYLDVDGSILTDGRRASANDLHHDWVGFDQGRPTVTFDLGTVCRIEGVTAGFLSRPEMGIHLPESVEILVSLDGTHWTTAGRRSAPVGQAPVLYLSTPDSVARYVRIVAQRKTWLFMDEIEVFGAATSDMVSSRPIEKVLFVASVTDEYDESRDRMVNLLQGMGLPFDLIQHDDIPDVELSHYQLMIVAGSAARELTIDDVAERRLVDAIAQGVNCLWIGRGIWGTFRNTSLADAFGIRYVEQGWSSEVGVARAQFTNLAGHPDFLTVHKEVLYKVKPIAAHVDGWCLRAEGNKADIPFVTRHRVGQNSGTAVYVSVPLLDLWKATEADDTYARAEVLCKYIRVLTGEGIVAKHPARGGKDAVFMLRLEDYTPGGTEMGHTRRTWLIRMEQLLQLTREHSLPLNIAMVPRYAHPFHKEYHDWGDTDAGIATLRRLAKRAFARGGSLIVHGYVHQNGEGPDDFSGDDWEMWDEDAKRFLTFEQQKRITDSAFAEIAEKWRVRPTVWETPHYWGNADTFRAAHASGFRYFTESDTKLFPNRRGFNNRAGGLLLNIPETAFNYPAEPDAIKVSGIVKQKHLLPRIVRLNGLFHVFYHNTSAQQQKALVNLLATAGRYDLWKPGLNEYATFWEARERAEVVSQIDPIQRRIIADVTRSFEGLTLSVRLPDGAAPARITIDGDIVEAAFRRSEGAWYIYPVLPEADRCRLVVEYREDTAGGTLAAR